MGTNRRNFHGSNCHVYFNDSACRPCWSWCASNDQVRCRQPCHDHEGRALAEERLHQVRCDDVVHSRAGRSPRPARFMRSHSPCRSPSDTSLPAVPAWITPALLSLTVRVWSKRYGRPIDDAEAVDILLRVGRLIDVLKPFHAARRTKRRIARKYRDKITLPHRIMRARSGLARYNGLVAASPAARPSP